MYLFNVLVNAAMTQFIILLNCSDFQKLTEKEISRDRREIKHEFTLSYE